MNVEFLIIFIGGLSVFRAYKTYNLIREEKGLAKANLFKFLNDRNANTYIILVRPFNKNMRNEKLKKEINLLTYLIYLLFMFLLLTILK